jgi:hypothetical protein
MYDLDDPYTINQNKKLKAARKIANEAIDALEELIHDGYDGTSMLNGMLEDVENMRKALRKQSY